MRLEFRNRKVRANWRLAPTMCILLSVFCFVSSATSDWRMFRKNALRNGFSEETGILNNPDSIRIKWEFVCSSGITFSSPVIGDINGDSAMEVVIGCDDYNLYALTGDTGTLLWTYPTGSWVRSSPLLIDVDGDDSLEIVFCSFDGKVYAVDGHGNYIWDFSTSGWIFSSPVGGDIDLDGMIEIVIGSYDDTVYVLNGMDGSLKWKYGTGARIESSPALGDINQDDTLEVVIGSVDHKFYALHQGDTLWTYQAGGEIYSTPAIGDLDGDNDLDVVFNCYDGYVYALDGPSGNELWSPFYTGGWIKYASPGLADIDGDFLLEIMTGSGGGERFYAIEGESGQQKWVMNPTDPQNWMIRTSPAIADINNDGELEMVLGTHDFRCTTVKSNSERLWQFPVGGDPHSSPGVGDIDGDGKVEIVIATLSGNVLAIDTFKEGVEESPTLNSIQGEARNPKLEIYPNPFTTKTVIRLEISEDRRHGTEDIGRIEIYDLVGRLVKSFSINDYRLPSRPETERDGIISIIWDGTDSWGERVAPSIYFCRLKVGAQTCIQTNLSPTQVKKVERL